MKNTLTRRLIRASLTNDIHVLELKDLNFIYSNLRLLISYDAFSPYPNAMKEIVYRLDNRFKPAAKAQEFLRWYDRRYTRSFVFNTTIKIRAQSIGQAEELAFLQYGAIVTSADLK